MEELLGMIIESAKQYAEVFAEQKISDAVIICPSYYNQAERRALKRAAEISGLKVLQLMNSHAAGRCCIHMVCYSVPWALLRTHS